MPMELLAAVVAAAAAHLTWRLLAAHPPARWVDLLGEAVASRRAANGLRSRLERVLVAAGLDEGRAPFWIGLQLAGALAALLLFALGIAGGAPPLLVVTVALAVVALPLLHLRDRRRRRLEAIGRALPWSLDLICLAVEVGVDFNLALARVVERARPGPWTEELAHTVRALRVGATRAEALEGLQSRVPHPAVERFCVAVIRADRLGTPLRRVLEAQAEDLRRERCLLAEKVAGEAPVKLLLPLIACIFPTVFLVLFGPIAFSMLHGGGLP